MTTTPPETGSADLPQVPYGPAPGAKVTSGSAPLAGVDASASGGKRALKIALRLLLPILIRLIVRALTRR